MQGIDPLAEAAAVEADVIQMFLSNPQGWEKPPERQDADKLRDSVIANLLPPELRLGPSVATLV